MKKNKPWGSNTPFIRSDKNRRENVTRIIKREKEKKDKARAEEWNDYFDFAETILPAGSMDIQKYLEPLVRKLGDIPDNEDLAGKSNEYFSIDNEYDEYENNLFQHVHFKKLPLDNEEVKKELEQIQNIKGSHLTPEAYEDFKEDWHRRSYRTLMTNLANLQGEYSNEVKQRAEPMDFSYVDFLMEIMNSSAAWNIAKKSTYDSEQALDNWLNLYEHVQRAYETDESIFGWVVQQIRAEKKNINQIFNEVNTGIKNKLAGKKSRRIDK